MTVDVPAETKPTRPSAAIDDRILMVRVDYIGFLKRVTVSELIEKSGRL